MASKIVTPTAHQLGNAELALSDIDSVDLLFMLALVMPDSDAGKALLILALFGRFRLEFGHFKLDYCGWIQDRR